MPAVSAKQYRYMQMVAHGSGKGPSEAVAKEFIRKTPAVKRRGWSTPKVRKP